VVVGVFEADLFMSFALCWYQYCAVCLFGYVEISN